MNGIRTLVVIGTPLLPRAVIGRDCMVVGFISTYIYIYIYIYNFGQLIKLFQENVFYFD